MLASEYSGTFLLPRATTLVALRSIKMDRGAWLKLVDDSGMVVSLSYACVLARYKLETRVLYP